jgi:hypothetical protein
LPDAQARYQEADAIVQRQVGLRFPGVLEIELRRRPLAADVGEGVGFRVRREVAEQRVGIGEVRVERVVGIDREAVVTDPRAAADAALALGVARVVEIAADFERVTAAQVGQVRPHRREPADAAIEQARVVGEVRRERGVAGDVAEVDARQHFPRVQLGMELRDVEAGDVAIGLVPFRVAQRKEHLRLAAGAEVRVPHDVRAQHFGVVAGEAAVGVLVVRVEPLPVRRPGRDARAPLVLHPVLEGER